MNNLEVARERWLADRPRHEEFARVLEARLRAALQPLGLWFEVDQRTKDIDSLIKKLLRKTKHSYESLPDKVGARVTVRYISDIPKVVLAVTTLFECGKTDLKNPAFDTVGYLSVHIDRVSLPKTDPQRRQFPKKTFWAEVQIRTQAQHLWSEMSHDSIYKNDKTIAALPEEIKRRVYLMAGQLEVADREFDRLASALPTKPAADLLRFLEPYYFSFTSRRPNVELSLEILEVLAPLYGAESAFAKDILRSFIDRNRPFLTKLYSQKQQPGATNLSPLLFQPEALAIYERINDDLVGLRGAWTQKFPEGELEKLASTFGMSTD